LVSLLDGAKARADGGTMTRIVPALTWHDVPLANGNFLELARYGESYRAAHYFLKTEDGRTFIAKAQRLATDLDATLNAVIAARKGSLEVRRIASYIRSTEWGRGW